METNNLIKQDAN